jgi:hypothetical protein
MRRSAAPSFRAAKRGKFLPPLLGSQQKSINISLNNQNNTPTELDVEVCKLISTYVLTNIVRPSVKTNYGKFTFQFPVANKNLARNTNLYQKLKLYFSL